MSLPALFHEPHGQYPRVHAPWNVLSEPACNGDDHSYQRLASQTPEEAADEKEVIRGLVLTKVIRSW